jgi:hypothetical protein
MSSAFSMQPAWTTPRLSSSLFRSGTDHAAKLGELRG